MFESFDLMHLDQNTENIELFKENMKNMFGILKISVSALLTVLFLLVEISRTPSWSQHSPWIFGLCNVS